MSQRKPTSFHAGEIYSLRGPHPEQMVLVLGAPLGVGRRDPEVLVAPVVRDVARTEASHYDVIVPADATDLSSPLVVAAWASSTVSLVCLGEVRGELLDSAEILEVVRDVRLALMDASVTPRKDAVGLLGQDAPPPRWHDLVASVMEGYWNGAYREACRREQVPPAEPARAECPATEFLATYSLTHAKQAARISWLPFGAGFPARLTVDTLYDQSDPAEEHFLSGILAVLPPMICVVGNRIIQATTGPQSRITNFLGYSTVPFRPAFVREPRRRYHGGEVVLIMTTGEFAVPAKGSTVPRASESEVLT